MTGFKEFVALAAALMSLTALSIDAVLPAFSVMRSDLNIADPNTVQYIIGVLFFGMCIGQLVFGPLSDSYGRKKTIYIGLSIFIFGCLLCITAQSFMMMLVGRAFQGFGVASTRVVTTAIVRDQYEGREMARVMSFVMAVFILVPALAPAIGQGILLVADWHAIFMLFLMMAIVNMTWMYLRLPETLSVDRRRPFSLRVIGRAAAEVVRHKISLGYTISAGLVFGGLIGYLTSAQQIFQEYYDLGELFSLYFGIVAMMIGIASTCNSMIVRRFGMRFISHYALIAQMVFSSAFVLYCSLHTGQVPFIVFMVFICSVFFCMGLLFGNLNAAALEPMGHIAGIASSVIGSLSSFISLTAGTIIGQAYNETLLPIAIGFLCLSSGSFIIQLIVSHEKKDVKRP